MTKFDDIYDIAADNHGLITSAQARIAGIDNNELVQYARRGRISKVGHGLYQLARWVPEANDTYAWAVLSVGPDALLYGESVLALHNLAPTNPARISVATPRRCRRALSGSIVVEHVNGIQPGAVYDGVPSQSVFDAIMTCKGRMMPSRLASAALKAREAGLISVCQYDRINVELGNDVR